MNTSWQKYWSGNTPDKERNAFWITLGSVVLFAVLGVLGYVQIASSQNLLPLSTILTIIILISLGVSLGFFWRRHSLIATYFLLAAWNILNIGTFLINRPLAGTDYAPLSTLVVLAITYFVLPLNYHFRVWAVLTLMGGLGMIFIDPLIPPLTPRTTAPSIVIITAWVIIGAILIFYFGRLGWQLLSREVQQVTSNARPSEAQLISQQERNAVRVFILLLLLWSTFILNTIVTVVSNGQQPINIVYVSINFINFALILVSGVYLWRKRYQLGTTIYIACLYIGVVTSILNLSRGNGTIVAIFAFVVPLATAVYTLPPRQISFWVLISSGVAILVTVLDLILPTSIRGAVSGIENTSSILIAIAIILFLLPVVLILRQFSLYPFEAKVILSLTSTTALLTLVVGSFALFQSSQTQNTLSQELKTSVQLTAETQLSTTVRSEAATIDNELEDVRITVQTLAQAMSNFYANEAIFAKGDYWDANKKLIRLPTGNSTSSSTDIASVVVPVFTTLNNAAIAEMNTIAQIDFIAPNLLKNKPILTSLYYVSANGVTRYYPNNNISSLVPPDFDPTQTDFYTIGLQKRGGGWSPSYQDQAGQGLIITYSYPVYDERNIFRGVFSADVKLQKITDRLNETKVGDLGYALLIDQKGTIISMPNTGYQDFDLKPEILLPGEPLKNTLIGKGGSDLQKVVRNMTLGQSGLDRVDIKGSIHYIAYTLLLEGGYSLGLVESYNDLNSVYLAANQSLESTAVQNRQVTAILIAFVVLLAALFSIGLTRLLVTPISRLTQIAEKIVGGNLNARATIETQDEIGTLALAFNNMTSQLQQTLTGLEERVADRTKALNASAEVSRRISTILDQQQLVSEVVEQVRNAFNYYHAHIYLFDSERQNLVMVGGTGEAGHKMLISGHKIQKGRGLVGRAADQNISILVPNTTKDPQWLPNPLLPDTRAEAAVPIALGDTVLGVLDIQQNTVNGLNQEDVDLLLSIANQVAVALQNTRAVAQTKQEAEYESLVNTIAQKIRETTTVKGAMQVAIRELGRATGAAHTKIKLQSEKSENQNS